MHVAIIFVSLFIKPQQSNILGQILFI